MTPTKIVMLAHIAFTVCGILMALWALIFGMPTTDLGRILFAGPMTLFGLGALCTLAYSIFKE